MPPSQISVTVLSPHDLVRTGLIEVLRRHADRVVLTPDPGAAARGADGVGPRRVVVYDVMGLEVPGHPTLEDVAQDGGATVVGLGRELRPDLEQAALAEGAVAVVPMRLGGEALVEVLTAAAGGDRGLLTSAVSGAARGSAEHYAERFGLTTREIQVLALIAAGLSNTEISETIYLSVNTIKVHIRNAYRKLGIRRRSEATAWALAAGIRPD